MRDGHISGDSLYNPVGVDRAGAAATSPGAAARGGTLSFAAGEWRTTAAPVSTAMAGTWRGCMLSARPRCHQTHFK